MSYALFDHDQQALEDLMHVVNPDDHDIVWGPQQALRSPDSLLGSLIWEIAADWNLSSTSWMQVPQDLGERFPPRHHRLWCS